MQTLFSKLTKYILCAALLGALALTLSKTVSAAPQDQGNFVVNTSADGNVKNNTLSLREAILLANHGTDYNGLARGLSDKERDQLNNCTFYGSSDNWGVSGCGSNNPDKITFKMPNCPCTIALDTVLPAITDQLVIDGYSQPGAAVNSSKKKFNGVVLVKLDGSALDFGEPGLQLQASSSNILGLEISSFKSPGILLSGNYDSIHGNLIHHNLQGGIIVSGHNNSIGNAISTRNVIYANSANGIEVYPTANNTAIFSNIIGSDVTAKNAVGNGFAGISISSSNNLIGKNFIFDNTGGGVRVGEANKYVTGNLLTQNTFRSNNSIGIDLAADGVTYNDVGTPPDGDTGVNNLQNSPFIKKATSASHKVSIDFRSAGSTKFKLEFYSTKNCDASGFGQGSKYLGTVELTTPANGLVLTTVTIKKFKPGMFITATATDPNNNTSEFSNCKKSI